MKEEQLLAVGFFVVVLIVLALFIHWNTFEKNKSDKEPPYKGGSCVDPDQHTIKPFNKREGL